jgi:hypothetical protein
MTAKLERTTFRTSRRNGATREEAAFLMRGRRVELNAFPSQDLVNWLEAKLRKHGVKKVIPDAGVLQEAYARAYVRAFIRDATPGLVEQARHRLDTDGVPDNLLDRVKALLAKNAGMPWDHAVGRVARAAVRGAKGDEPAGGNSPR